MPNEATAGEILEANILGWRLGLKSLAIYRDGSKRTQPLTAGGSTGELESDAVEPEAEAPSPKPQRRRLPDVRQAITHKFSIAGHDGYLTVGLYDDGQPGEVFLKMAKEGSTISGLMDSVALLTSVALQYGVPLKPLVDKFSHKRFEPAGFTQNPEIPFAKSVTDYVFRWLGLRFLTAEAPAEDAQEQDPVDTGLTPAGRTPAGRTPGQERIMPIRGGSELEPYNGGQEDAPPCMICGSIMTRVGACYSCGTCGESGGCG
jgi:ribonucleoside-diphosphate reductase alpha chain